MKRAILVNGVPASGKSTVTQGLVAALEAAGLTAIPFTLDTVKEGLYAHLGVGDRDHNRLLGRASYHTIFDLIADLPDGVVPIVDAWHGFQPRALVADHIARAGLEPENVIEVWCDVSPATAAHRYRARSSSRHEGHPPASYADELYELARRAEPFAFGESLRIDTERPIEPTAFDAILDSLSGSSEMFDPVAERRIEQTVTIEELAHSILASQSGQRLVIALAGPPGSGKSHLAAALEEALKTGGRPAVFPMDGFHYDDAVLSARGLLHRKGAPETFDVAGFSHTLARLIRNDEPEIAVPVFDRSIEISRAGGRIIGQDVNILIVEGNYLLLDCPPWRDLREHFDVTVRIDTRESELRARLTQRWVSEGLEPEEITRKVEENDLPNCRFVKEHSLPADFVISS